MGYYKRYICPKCGKRTMTRNEVEPGKYILVCSICGFQHLKLPQEDKKKGIV